MAIKSMFEQLEFLKLLLQFRLKPNYFNLQVCLFLHHVASSVCHTFNFPISIVVSQTITDKSF